MNDILGVEGVDHFTYYDFPALITQPDSSDVVINMVGGRKAIVPSHHFVLMWAEPRFGPSSLSKIFVLASSISAVLPTTKLRAVVAATTFDGEGILNSGSTGGGTPAEYSVVSSQWVEVLSSDLPPTGGVIEPITLSVVTSPPATSGNCECVLTSSPCGHKIATLLTRVGS